MRTIRRIYLYTVAFISLEVIIWGLIGMARSAFSGGVGGSTSQLAGALSSILVGVPVFLLHWIPAQRMAHKDKEERTSRVRAIFFYGLLLATLIPIAQNILSLINRFWLNVFNLPAREAFLGLYQTWPDNLIAMVMNGLVAGYVFSVLRQDWEESPHSQTFVETRRWFRYIWVLYGLTMLMAGLVQVLQFVFSIAETVGTSRSSMLANGLTLLIAGIPVWIYFWTQVQRSLKSPDEKASLLRRVILSILSLIGVGGVLIPAGIILTEVFQVIFGKPYTFTAFLNEISVPLSTLIAMGVLWFYYGRMLQVEIEWLPASPRRAALKRIYNYLLAFLGLGATFIGIYSLLTFLSDLILELPTVSGEDWLQTRLSAALATIVVGLPLWVKTWRPLVSEALQEDESGDHARRSLVRKIYLYLVIFTGVMGTMFSAGALLYQLINALLGSTQSNFLRTVFAMSELLILFIGLMAYHWKALRMDNSLAEAALQARYAKFPVLVLVRELEGFAENLTTAIARKAAGIPVTVHIIEQGLPEDEHANMNAVVITSEQLFNLPPAYRTWVENFNGERIVVPVERADGWRWVFSAGLELSIGAQRAANMLASLAEGEEPAPFRDISSGRIALYVLGGMLGLPMLLGVIGTILEFLF
ncbi:MAG: hypothetical protein IMY76_08160 [Chloroflexi bacterium]|nr:hypothetical protein [Chloroflexota bacterium]